MNFISQQTRNTLHQENRSRRNESTSSRTVIVTSQSNDFDSHEQMRRKHKCCGIMRKSTARFMGLCIFGISFLIGGSTLIVLYFASTERRGYLIPALALFVAGIAITSVGEWYCRSKLRRNNLARRRRQRATQRRRARRVSSNDRPEYRDIPPPYSEHSSHELPTANTSYSNSIVTVDIGCDQLEPTNQEPPLYYSVVTNITEVLPSYQEATDTNFEGENKS